MARCMTKFLSRAKFKAKLGNERSITTETVIPPQSVEDNKLMSAWQLHDYDGGVSGMALSQTVRVPPISCPFDVLVEVKAASVNPIDVMMAGNLYLLLKNNM